MGAVKKGWAKLRQRGYWDRASASMGMGGDPEEWKRRRQVQDYQRDPEGFVRRRVQQSSDSSSDSLLGR